MQHRSNENRHFVLRTFLHIMLLFPVFTHASEILSTNALDKTGPRPLATALSQAKWHQVEAAVDGALKWLATQQAGDGSFPTIPSGQPAVTSLCVLAFLSRGHLPQFGPYGGTLNRAIDFVLDCQRPDGLFSYQTPGNVHEDKQPSHAAVYNHAIAGLMLAEVYGHVQEPTAAKAKRAIEKALQFTRALQLRPKAHPNDAGGWRYLHLRFSPSNSDSDLSVTGWQLMFLRSAKNAEFKVPDTYIDDALKFVRRCWDENDRIFYYGVDSPDVRTSRGIVGVGILSLSLAGQHQTPMAKAAGDWLLAHPFSGLTDVIGGGDRCFYSAYYCSQAMAQLGGRYWEGFFPSLADLLVSSQLSDGSWPPEPARGDAVFGNALTTALAVLALTPPYQLLPVYQR